MSPSLMRQDMGRPVKRAVPFKTVQVKRAPYLPGRLAMGFYGVGAPDEQDRTVRIVEVDLNIVSINRKYCHFLDITTSGSPDVRVQGEYRDIRRPYRHTPIRASRHPEPTQPECLCQRKSRLDGERYSQSRNRQCMDLPAIQRSTLDRDCNRKGETSCLAFLPRRARRCRGRIHSA